MGTHTVEGSEKRMFKKVKMTIRDYVSGSLDTGVQLVSMSIYSRSNKVQKTLGKAMVRSILRSMLPSIALDIAFEIAFDIALEPRACIGVKSYITPRVTLS